jgi:hypothetical protein
VRHMTFVTAGLAIAGAIGMAIPIIIHLLSRQRRKPIEWAAMRFLFEAFRKHRRRLRVEQLLLLLTRCLIVLLLGAALARPMLEAAGVIEPGGGRTVYFVIDDGLASGVDLDADTTALDRHIAQAIEIIRSLDASDRVGIVTAARPARVLLSPPSSDHRAVMNLLRTLRPSDATTDFAGAFRSLRSALETQDMTVDRTFVYLLSEFRAGSAALDSALPSSLRDLEGRLTLLATEPAETTISNVQVRAIEPVRHVVLPGAADGAGQVTVRLVRHGATLERDVTRVRLRAEGLPAVEPRTVNWEPGQTEASIDFMLNVAGESDREVQLSATIDDDALKADNQRRTLIETRTKLRVVLLDRRTFGFEPTVDRFTSGRWIRRALEPYEGGPVEVVDVEPTALDVADLRTTELVIASRPDLIADAGWSLLNDFVSGGGVLIVVPPGEMNIHQWIERMKASLDLPWRIMLETHDHDEGLFLSDQQPASEIFRMLTGDLDELARPIVAFRSLSVDEEQTHARTLLRFENGQPLLLLGSPEPDRENGAPGNDDAGDQRGEDGSAEQGLVIMFTTALELNWTNLPAKPLMVPMMHELVRQGVGVVRSRQQHVAGTRPALHGYRAAVELIGPDDQIVPLDDARRPRDPLVRAGAYRLRDAVGQTLGTIVVNIDPMAGDTSAQPSAAVLSWLADTAEPGAWSMLREDDPSAALRVAGGGTPIAGIVLALLLAFVIIETLFARWFSHAFRDEAIDGTPAAMPRSSPLQPGGAA